MNLYERIPFNKGKYFLQDVELNSCPLPLRVGWT